MSVNRRYGFSPSGDVLEYFILRFYQGEEDILSALKRDSLSLGVSVPSVVFYILRDFYRSGRSARELASYDLFFLSRRKEK